MITGYSTVNPVVLWLMLGHIWFFLFGVFFFNLYRFLDCCTVLSGKVFLQFLLWRISLFFHSLWSDLFYSVDACTFSWMLALWDMLFCIAFVHRIVITHLRCRTSLTTRTEKTTDKTTKYVTTKTAGILYPTIPCNNPESDTGWKTHQTEKKNKEKKPRCAPTSAIIQRDSQLNIPWSSTHR